MHIKEINIKNQIYNYYFDNLIKAKKLETKYIIISVQNSPQQSANAEGFAEAYLCFFSICLGKKNAEAIELLEILKKYFSNQE